jgi:hypothetical protein
MGRFEHTFHKLLNALGLCVVESDVFASQIGHSAVKDGFDEGGRPQGIVDVRG